MVTLSQSLSDTGFVDLQSVISEAIFDIRYASENNFMKKKVYPEARCVLRKKVAERLKRVSDKLILKGYRLKIFDAYRPLSVQWKLWEVVPDPRFVADPRKGSKHNRGAAVDLTLTDLDGNELQMPTAYDEFIDAARSDYRNLPEKVLANRTILHDAMKSEGFIPNPSEWWHFDSPDWKTYSISDVPFSKIK
ncbi:MAG: M15 family metallopeptidase [Chloroherpetonaceae bacterium]|nr:M15 family metallopeptidase [Chloroherpetonaceae bacterium]